MTNDVNGEHRTYGYPQQHGPITTGDVKSKRKISDIDRAGKSTLCHGLLSFVHAGR
jgi:hypothetical protein